MRWSRAFLTWLVVAPVACGDGRSVEPNALSGHVTDTAQESVAGATVFAIPAELVAGAASARDISAAATLDYDEPLENLIEAQGGSFPRAVTAADGAYTLSLPAGPILSLRGTGRTARSATPAGRKCIAAVSERG